MPKLNSGTIASTSSACRFEWHRSIPEILCLGPEWDRRLETWGVDCTFLRWDWIRTWLRTYGQGSRLLVGVFRSGETVLGFAPLHFVEEKIGPVGPVLRSIRLIGDGPLCPDHLVLPVAPGQEEAYARLLIRDLTALRKDWDRVELRDLLETHPAWQRFEAIARAAGCAVEVQPRTHCPYIKLPPTWEEYLDGQPKKIRYQFRRLGRDMDNPVLVTPQSIAEVDLLMQRLEDLHAQAWQERGQPGVFVNPRFRLFHRIHARRAFRSGRLVLIALRAKERELAASYGFRRRDACEGYQFGYDPALKTYSPGTAIVLSNVRRTIELGLPEMDMLRGSGDYKYRITENERRGIDVILARGTTSDRAARLASDTRRLAGGVFRSVLNRKQIARVKRMLHIQS